MVKWLSPRKLRKPHRDFSPHFASHFAIQSYWGRWKREASLRTLKMRHQRLERQRGHMSRTNLGFGKSCGISVLVGSEIRGFGTRRRSNERTYPRAQPRPLGD